MTLEEILSNINYNIKKIVEELRKRIIFREQMNVDDRNIIYQHSGEDFCIVRIKKNYLEIDFKADKIIEDPMEFSWKIKQTRDQKFNRRMQIKNICDIDIAFGLIFQSYNCVTYE